MCGRGRGQLDEPVRARGQHLGYLRREVLVVGDEPDRLAAPQGGVDVGHHHVEADRGEERSTVGAEPGVGLDGPVQVVRHPVVRAHHALGPAARSGGVDDVGQLLRPDLLVQVAPLGRPGGPERLQQLVDAQGPRTGELLVVAMGGVGDDDRGPHVLHDVPPPLVRVTGRQRHVGATGLHHGEETDQQLHGPGQAHDDQGLGSDAVGAQPARQDVRPRVELLVGQLQTSGAQRDAVRNERGLGLEPAVDRLGPDGTPRGPPREGAVRGQGPASRGLRRRGEYGCTGPGRRIRRCRLAGLRHHVSKL